LGFGGYDKVDKRLTASSKPFIFNHFEVIRGICTKTNLIKSLRSYYEESPLAREAKYSLFDTTPTTFVIARATDDKEIQQFMHRFREIIAGGSKNERVPNKHCTENMWVVKPAALNQGRGIEVFKNLRDITEFIY
jgi:Tubulin-tyrosine ligase family